MLKTLSISPRLVQIHTVICQFNMALVSLEGDKNQWDSRIPCFFDSHKPMLPVTQVPICITNDRLTIEHELAVLEVHREPLHVSCIQPTIPQIAIKQPVNNRRRCHNILYRTHFVLKPIAPIGKLLSLHWTIVLVFF